VPLNGGQAWAQTRESLSWIRMTRTARQDARRSGKEDAGHSLLLGGCLFRFYGEHNSKNRKGSCRDVQHTATHCTTSQVIPTSQINSNTCEYCSCLKRDLSFLHVNVSHHTTLQHAATPGNTHLRMLTCHVKLQRL